MKKEFLLKAIVVIVPVIVAFYAGYYEHKKQQKIEANYQHETHLQKTTQVASI
jgi:hypothetical protein